MSNKKQLLGHKASNHKWNIITDKCDRCGLQRKFIVHSTYTMIMKYKGYEYLVGGKWQSERPDCKQI